MEAKVQLEKIHAAINNLLAALRCQTTEGPRTFKIIITDGAGNASEACLTAHQSSSSGKGNFPRNYWI